MTLKFRNARQNLAVLVLCGTLQANPISIHIINEVLVSDSDSLGWMLEFQSWPGLINDYDGWFIITPWGTAHFNQGITTTDQDLVLINKDSLDTPIPMFREGGVIALFDQDSFRVEEVRWGSVANPDIGTPLPSQSMCYHYDWPPGEVWYLDDSPSLGDWNDHENALGSISGTVYDLNGIPVPNALMLYGYGFTQFVVANSQGQYELENLACLTHLRVNINEVDEFDTTFQVYPDSTIQMDCHLPDYLGVHSRETGAIPAQYHLAQNFPNPFNAMTTLKFDTPQTGKVNIQILNLDGSLVTSLVHQTLLPGSYEVAWNASQLSSGVYLCQMRAGAFTDTKKLIIIK